MSWSNIKQLDIYVSIRPEERLAVEYAVRKGLRDVIALRLSEQEPIIDGYSIIENIVGCWVGENGKPHFDITNLYRFFIPEERFELARTVLHTHFTQPVLRHTHEEAICIVCNDVSIAFHHAITLGASSEEQLQNHMNAYRGSRSPGDLIRWLFAVLLQSKHLYHTGELEDVRDFISRVSIEYKSNRAALPAIARPIYAWLCARMISVLIKLEYYDEALSWLAELRAESSTRFKKVCKQRQYLTPGDEQADLRSIAILLTARLHHVRCRGKASLDLDNIRQQYQHCSSRFVRAKLKARAIAYTAETYVEQGEFEAAVARYDEAIYIDRSNMDDRYSAAYLHRNLTHAMEASTRWRETAPKNTAAQNKVRGYRKAIVALQRNMNATELKNCKHLLRYGPRSPQSRRAT